jgi:molecular chaperone DnaK (HSP70)
VSAAIVYGVDFGTSTSAVTVGQPDGTLVQVKDPAATNEGFSIPTSVFVGKRTGVLVGLSADNQLALSPGDHRTEFKLDLGSMEIDYLGGKPFTADELATEVLRYLRACARATVEGDPEIVVITIPAPWMDTEQEKRMKAAAAAAGFDPATLHCVAEPVAALASVLAEHRPARGDTFCVYDLGGGTFDCAVARSTGDDFELLGSPGGDPEVGGGRFDRLILDWVRAQYPGPSAALFDGPTTDRSTLHDRILALEQCRKLKLALSVRERFAGPIWAIADDAEVEMSQADLMELIGPDLRLTLDATDQAVADAGLTWDRIDAIVPVGGSCRLPMIGQLLSDHTGRRVRKVANPDLAVVTGAALLARRLLTVTALPPGLDPDDPVVPILRAGLSRELVRQVLRRDR